MRSLLLYPLHPLLLTRRMYPLRLLLSMRHLLLHPSRLLLAMRRRLLLYPLCLLLSTRLLATQQHLPLLVLATQQSLLSRLSRQPARCWLMDGNLRVSFPLVTY